MKVRVTIEAELPDHVPGYGEGTNILHVVQLTLCDALAEFVSHRSPAETYVETRYGEKGYKWVKKDEKIAQVRMRNSIAAALSHRVMGEFGSMTVEEIKP